MKSTLLKYKLGLLVIGLFAVFLLVFVLLQANAAKQDVKTTKAARATAEKLSNYVLEKQTIPSTLSSAGLQDVPATIRYEKLSASQYKFCITYKTKRTGFDASSAAQQAIIGYYSAGESSGDYTSERYLTIPDAHQKGENCQTIEPLSYPDYDSYDGNTYDDSEMPYTTPDTTDQSSACNDPAYAQYFESLCS